MNRAIDYITTHLDQSLRLEDVAEAACFSPFHFHRVFRSIIGETLNQFVRRVRLERALSMMSHAQDQSLTEIAHACGFASSSDFSRNFKQRYGMPPSAFDIRTWRDSRRDELQTLMEQGEGYSRIDRLPQGSNPDGFTVEVRQLPPRTVAYIRVLDPYQGSGVMEAAEQLMQWADALGVGSNQWLGYMWEDPEIVALKDCRYDVAVEVDDVQPDGVIGRFDFPAMRVAHIEIRGPIELEMRALDWIYGTWLPSSNVIPDELPCFESWYGRPFAHGVEHFELALQLPIRQG